MTELVFTTVHVGRLQSVPSAFDTPYPSPLTFPEGPDFFAFPDPNRGRGLYNERTEMVTELLL